jgi:hypothetical protein
MQQSNSILAKDMVNELIDMCGTQEEGQAHAMSFVLCALLEQEKKIKTLEIQCENLSYRYLEEREKRMFRE